MTKCAAWKQYSWNPDRWALMASPETPVRYAAALVKQLDDGRWFAEHYPYMGQFDVFNTIEEAKQWAGGPCKALMADLPPSNTQ